MCLLVLSGASDPVFQVFRFRILIQPEERLELNPHHAALIYATLASAYGIAAKCDSVLPEGAMTETPEQGRIVVNADEQFALGWTLIAAGAADARLRCTRLIDGMKQLGARARNRSQPLGGGFQVRVVEDVIADCPWDGRREMIGINHATLAPYVSQWSQSMSESPLVIHFRTPLRMSRPKSRRTAGHAFFDSQWFDTAVWLGRIKTRLAELGLAALCPAIDVREHAADASELVWIDIPYKGTGGEKSLGGVVGKVNLGRVHPDWAAAITWCQLLGVGESTRMGLGRYQIVPVVAAVSDDVHGNSSDGGQSPATNADGLPERLFGPLRRWKSLAELALSPAAIDRGASRYQLPAGATVATVEAIRGGTYRPDPPVRFELRDGDRRPRAMCVPSKRDRAIQQAVLESIAPALDRFFESSSFAFRKGLGRHSAAAQIEKISKQGYTWAVRSDIHRFFDRVDHALLRTRIAAYLPDTAIVELLMTWVQQADTAGTGKGLPTGAPVSPVLANLLLDQFDEQLAIDHAKLVRYADDFLILHRTQGEAEAALQSAHVAAQELKLQLSETKTSLLGPGETFDFLGFRFARDEQWRFHSLLPPTTLPGLGWVDLSKVQSKLDPPETHYPLPGESVRANRLGDVVAVLSRRVTRIDAAPGRFMALDRAGRTLRELSSQRIGFILIQGTPEVSAAAWHQIIENQIDLMMVGNAGRPVCQIRTRPQVTSTDARIAQVRMANEPLAALPAARQLVHAKLQNTAITCRAIFQDAEGVATSQQLLELAERSLASTDHASLLGYEGSGAAAWYRLYGARLPKHFRFDRREAPRSRTPGNVLLNIAYSHLHRLCESAAVAAGLMPDLGVLHQVRSGHLALASDLQEPFRHLADRAVMIAATRLSPGDFTELINEQYPLKIESRAMRRLFEVLYRNLSLGCTDVRGAGGSYREHIFRQARHLRRWLVEPKGPLDVFRHP